MDLEVRGEGRGETLRDNRAIEVSNMAELFTQRRHLGDAMALIDPPDRLRITDGVPEVRYRTLSVQPCR